MTVLAGATGRAGDSRVELHTGDTVAVLSGMRESSVDCVVTSPPYWGLRDYRIAGQYGCEDTVTAYVETLCRVFDEVARVLSRRGTVWLNLGDSFGGSWGNYVAAGSTAPSARTPARARCRQGTHRPPQSRHRPKDLVGVPWRTVFALAERGWLVRNAIVWTKPNARPESVRDRLSQRYEMLFLLARSENHWFASSHAGRMDATRAAVAAGDVWRLPTPRSPTGHAAVGSLELARRCIALGARPGGTVLDPFSGSGTTGVAARMLGHHYIGIDIDPACHEIATRCVGRVATQTTRDGE
jgi:site-specific DNA-methyltransferase (adenine-specific)